jgi:hypothetical protein
VVLSGTLLHIFQGARCLWRLQVCCQLSSDGLQSFGPFEDGALACRLAFRFPNHHICFTWIPSTLSSCLS